MKKTGSKKEITEQLTELADGAEHLGNARLAEQARHAIAAVNAGSREVQPGHILYVVEE
jgi:hypothetical protein